MKDINSNQIINKIFNFYSSNKKACDNSYQLAEDPKIRNIYDNISDIATINSLLTKTSIIILTANKYEKNILHQKIYQLYQQKIARFDIELSRTSEHYNRAYAYYFKICHYSILHIHANVTGSYSISGSADLVRWVLNNKYLLPTAIISLGVCFGTNEEKQEIGDVIISKKVYPYFIGVKVNGRQIKVVDDNMFETCSDLINKIKDLKNNNQFNNLGFDVLFENYITGEAVVSSKQFRKQFTSITTQEIFAGDMEGYGLYKECRSNNHSIPCLIVKSICDWGIDKNINAKDPGIQNLFLNVYQKHNNSIGNIESIIDTLKDRLQAYSANCAFNVLQILLQGNIFNISFLEKLQNIIISYNGAVITCKKYKELLHNIVVNSKYGYDISNAFAHRCLMILESRQIVKCENECINNNNLSDECTHPSSNASIDILRKK